jgi:hypothetical protein
MVNANAVLFLANQVTQASDYAAVRQFLVSAIDLLICDQLNRLGSLLKGYERPDFVALASVVVTHASSAVHAPGILAAQHLGSLGPCALETMTQRMSIAAVRSQVATSFGLSSQRCCYSQCRNHPVRFGLLLALAVATALEHSLHRPCAERNQYRVPCKMSISQAASP